MIRIGIIGGAGYTAGELLRLLLNHPEVEIKFVHSLSGSGKLLSDVHSGLLGETALRFSETLDYTALDLLFFCTAHGDTKKFMEQHDLPASLKIIDLSTDYRAKGDHGFVYGLPELQRDAIASSRRVSNPGCFATAIQLGLLPLAAAGLLQDDVHVNAITGSTGAGQQPTTSTHFSWRNNNLSVYKPFAHQHLAEIKQSLGQAQGEFNQELHFIPVRGDFSRGIFAMLYTHFEGTLEEAKELYASYYVDAPFVVISERNLDLKEVVNTNRCALYLEKHGSRLLIISCIDNLLKGASGQAVQNMNLMFGLPETAGLKLKSLAF